MTMTSALVTVLAIVRVFVSPEGNDANPGTEERPVRTLEAARDAVRRARTQNPQAFAAGGAEVVLADGVYARTAPLVLTAADGGTATSPVVWKAARRARAVISGELALSSWGAVEDPKALALLGEEARRHVRVATIAGAETLPGFRCGGCGTAHRLQETPVSVFCDGQRLPQSRWPNETYARVGRLVGKVVSPDHGGAITRSGLFEFDSPRLAKWAAEPELWAYGLWKYEWADATVSVRGVDAGTRQISVDPEPMGFGMGPNAQFKIRNALSEIDEPGEWVLDRASRRLYCWLPREGASVAVAFASGLVKAANARNLRFEDLAFEYARGPAVVFETCSGCAVTGSTLRHTSSWGVRVKGGADDRVEGCDLFDLGEGGIELEGGNRETLVPARHVADNNHIHHHGQVIPNYRPGIQLSGVGNRATHNLIHHTLHQAIAFDGNDHSIAYNVCHDCCMYNDDAGTIYCCQRDWRKRGTVIEHNLVHMTGKQPRGRATQAVYLDDFSSGVIVRNNILNRAELGVYIGGGQDCEVSGNLIFNCTHGLCLGSRGIETFGRAVSGKGFDSDMFKTLRKTLRGPLSAMWRARYPKMDDVLYFDDGKAAHNAHWNVLTNNVCVGCRGQYLDNWKNVSATCTVTNNLETMTDPGVTDYYGLDWSAKPGSELARRLGDLKFAEMGLYASPRRASPAVRFGPGVTKPRAFGEEYDLAVVRVDVPFLGKLPEGQNTCATDLKNCSVPEWSRGTRVVTGFGTASFKDWQDYRFTFTPTVTGDFELVLMGVRGEKTLYDAFKVEGATLEDGGFETGRGWTVPKAVNPKDHRFNICNTKRPWGVVTADEAHAQPAEGAKMWCGNDLIGAKQKIRCQALVPVTVSFRARALPIPEAR